MTPKPKTSPIPVPKGTDPKWREKIDQAKRARAIGAAARKDKPSSFRGAASYYVQ